MTEKTTIEEFIEVGGSAHKFLQKAGVYDKLKDFFLEKRRILSSFWEPQARAKVLY